MVEILIDKFRFALEARGDFLQRRAKCSVKVIRDAGELLDKRVEFIVCT